MHYYNRINATLRDCWRSKLNRINRAFSRVYKLVRKGGVGRGGEDSLKYKFVDNVGQNKGRGLARKISLKIPRYSNFFPLNLTQ